LHTILPIQQSQEMMIRQDCAPDPDDRQMILRGDPARNPAQKTVESMGLNLVRMTEATAAVPVAVPVAVEKKIAHAGNIVRVIT
jgi:hypothetical protein